MELELAETFSELAGYDRYEKALEEWGAWRAAGAEARAADEFTKARKRKRDAGYVKARRKSDPTWRKDYWRGYHQQRYATSDEYRDRKRQSAREYQRQKRLAMGIKPRQFKKAA